MNYRFMFSQLGLLFLTLAAALLAMAGVFLAAQWLGDHTVDTAAAQALVVIGVAGAILGGVLHLLTRGASQSFYRREAMLLVAMSWVLGGAFCALPFFLWTFLGEGLADHPFRSFVNCYFESISGLTTAGSSILSDIEAVPASLLLWRSFIQWIGGIGIVVIFVAVLPVIGTQAKHIMFFEVSGVTREGLMPSIRQTARVLVTIYVLLTSLQVLALLLCGMTTFDAVCHSFTTLATGGYSTRNASVGAYESGAIDIITTIFMMLGGVNFGLFFMLWRGRFKEVFKDVELRVYLALLIGASALIGLIVWLSEPSLIMTTGAEQPASWWESLRAAFFNVVSVQTTTGYATTDYNLWPNVARGIMFALILCGGCAGSTAGGLKIIRLVVIYKILLSMLERAYRRHVVRPVKVARQSIDEETQLTVVAHVLLSLIILGGGTLALMALESDQGIDTATAASACAATFCTTGPGFNLVGPIANFGWMSDASKLIICSIMLLGRLEVLTLAAIFTPGFWRND